MSATDFEAAVRRALETIPVDLQAAIENVAVTVEDQPSVEDLRSVGLKPEVDTLLGLYQGVPLPERGPSTYGLDLPDRIVVYRRPLLEVCGSRRELLREIRRKPRAWVDGMKSLAIRDSTS